MPFARASRRGFALNWRFAVNGIQNASRSPCRTRAGVSCAFMAGDPRGSRGIGHGQMIKKIDTKLNLPCTNRPESVYYNRHHEHRRGSPSEGREADVRSVATRIGEARGRNQRLDFLDRTESRQPLGQLAEKGARRHSHGIRGFFHSGYGRKPQVFFPRRGVDRHRHRQRRTAPGRQPLAQRSMSILHERYAAELRTPARKC